MAGKTYVSTLIFKSEDRTTTTIKKLDKALGSLQNTASKLNVSASAISQVSKSLDSFGVVVPGVTLISKSLKGIGKVKLAGVSKSVELLGESAGGISRLSKEIKALDKELGDLNSGAGGLGPLSKELREISKIKFTETVKGLTAINKAISKLATNEDKINKVANGIKSLSHEIKSIASVISFLESLGKKLEVIGKVKITDAVKSLAKISKSASKLEKVGLSVKSLSDALSKLCHSMECVQVLEKALRELSKVKLGGLGKSLGSLSKKAKQLDALAKALKGLSGATPNLGEIIKPLTALSKIKSISKLASGLKKIDKALGDLKGDLTALVKLSKALEELCKKVDCIKVLADVLKNLSSSMKGLNSLVSRFNRISASMAGLGTTSQSLGGFAGLRGGLGALDTALGVTGGAIKAFTAILAKLSFEASKLVAILAKNIVQSAIDVESQFAGVLKTTDGLGIGIESLTKEGSRLFQQFRDISKEKPFSFEDIALVGKLGGQLGVASDALDEFAITMKELDLSTNLKLEKGSQQVAQLMNVMGTAGPHVRNLGSALVDLGNNSATTERDIMNMAQRIASAGNVAGMTEADVLGISAAFSSVGVRAEAGGTAIQKAFGEIQNHVSAGGAKLELLANTAGMTAAEFAKAWKANAAEAFSAFVVGLDAQGTQARGVLQELFGKSSRLETAFMSVTKAGNLLPESIARANRAWRENTALTKEATARYNTTSSRIGVLINRVKDLGVTFGLEMLPAVGMAVNSLDPLIKQFELHAPSAAQKLGEFLKTQAVPAFALIIRSAAAAVPKVIAFGKSMLTVGKFAVKGSTQALTWGTNVGVLFAKGLIKSLSFVVKAISKLSSIVSYWLKPHSPPKALPNIDKWGFDTARVYTDSFEKGFVTASFDGVHEFAKNAETELSFSVSGANAVSSEYLDKFFAPFNESDFSAIDNFTKSAKDALSLELDGSKLELAVADIKIAFTNGIAEAKTFGSASTETLNRIQSLSGDSAAAIGSLSEDYYSLLSVSERVDESTKSLIDSLSDIDVTFINSFSDKLSSALTLDGDEATVAVAELTQSFMQATKEVEQFGVASESTMQAIALAAGDVGVEVLRIAEIELELNGLEKAEADLKAYSKGYLDLIEISNRVDTSTKSVIDSLSQVDVSSIDKFVASASAALTLDGDEATVAIGQLTQGFMQATKEVEQFGVASDSTMQAIALAAGDVGVEVMQIAILHMQMSAYAEDASKIQALAAADTTTALQEQAGALSEIATTTADWSSASFKALNDVTSAFDSFSEIGPSGMIELKKAFTSAIDEIDDFGSVSSSSFNDVDKALGNVQPEVKELAKNYLDLAEANSVLTKAQEELTSVTEKYNKALEPLNDREQAIDDEQTKLEIQERIAKLNAELAGVLTARQRRIKELEIQKQQLALEKQVVEIQQREAVDAAEDKVTEAQNLVDAQEEELAQTQSLVDLNQSIVSFGQEIIDQRKAGYEALQAEIKAKQDALSGEIESIQNKLALEKTIQDGQKASLALQKQAVSDAQAEIKTRKDALNDEITAIQKKLSLEKTIQDGHKAAAVLRIKKTEDVLGFNNDILGSLKSQVDELNAASSIADDLSDAIGDSSTGADDLAAAIGDSSTGADDLAAAIGDSSTGADDLAAAIGDSSTGADDLAAAIGDSSTGADDLAAAIGLSNEEMDRLLATTQDINGIELKLLSDQDWSDFESISDPFAGFDESIAEMEKMFEDAFSDFDTSAFDELDTLFSDLTTSIDTLSTNLSEAESDFNAATGGIQSIGNAASEFLDGAGKSFSEFFDIGLVEALTPKAETLDGIKAWLHENLPNAITEAGEFWRLSWEQSGQLFTDAILDRLFPGRDITKAFLSGEMQVWAETAASSFVQGFYNYFDVGIPQAVEKITDLFAYWFKPNSPPRVLSEIELWGLGAAEAYINGFVSFFNGTGEIVGSAVHDYVVTPLTSWYGSGVESDTSTSLTSLSNLFSGKLGEVGSSIASSVSEDWLPGFIPLTDAFVTGLPEDLVTMQNNFISGFGGISTSIATSVSEEWLPAFAPLTNAFITGLPEDLATMQNNFTSGFGGISTSIVTSVSEEWLPGLAPLAETFVTGLPEDLATMQNNFTSGFGGISTSITTSVSEEWLPAFVPLTDAFVTGLPEDLATMQNSFMSGFTSITDNMSERVAHMMSDSDDLSEKFKKEIPSALLSLKKSFETEFPILSNVATQSLAWVGDSAESARKYIKKLEKKLRSFYDWITNINIPNPFAGWTDVGSQEGYSPPSYDVGTSYHPGGLAYVHQDELVVMPPGSRVYTKAETANLISQAMQNNANTNAPAQQIKATFVFQVETPLDVEEVAYEVMARVKDGIYA